MTRFKICCIKSVDEARLAIRYGASAIGLVSAMPSGPGPIPDEHIADIARAVPPGVSTFLLTSLRDVAAIVKQHDVCRTSTIQLVDSLASGTHRELRAALPGIKIVQVIHVTDADSVDEARAVSAQVDGLLLDSGNPKLAVKELGGTGRVHDWSLSRQIRESVSVPMFLAGGLRSENVATAIRQVNPYGVDVCTGVRTDDRLDERKLAAFVEAASDAG